MLIYAISILAINSYNVTGYTVKSTIPYEETTIFLKYKESLGSAKPMLTEANFDALKSRFIVTPAASSRYCQKIKFVDTGGLIQPGRAELYNNKYVIKFIEYNSFFEYEFALCDTANGISINLEKVPITFLGQDFTIVSQEITGINGEIKLLMIADPLLSSIGTTKKLEYDYLGEKHTIENIGSYVQDGSRIANLRVDGEDVKLKENSFAMLKNGLYVGVEDILMTAAGDIDDTVYFYLATNTIQLKDNNYKDRSYYKGGAFVANEHIPDSSVRIIADYEGHDQIKIKSINYRLRANSVKGDIYVNQGEGIRQHLKKPEGMLTKWDIIFDGYDTNSESYIVKITFGESLPKEKVEKTAQEPQEIIRHARENVTQEEIIQPGKEKGMKKDTKILIYTITTIIVMVVLIVYLIMYIRKK